MSLGHADHELVERILVCLDFDAAHFINAINYDVSNAAPVDLNEDFPVEKLEEFIREYAAGNVGSNVITITVADPDTYAVAGGQPEQYELVCGGAYCARR